MLLNYGFLRFFYPEEKKKKKTYGFLIKLSILMILTMDMPLLSQIPILGQYTGFDASYNLSFSANLCYASCGA